ncbi:hypothetical protein WR25_05132 isoform A [Diploscapter pachys]|uniref:PLD phosphodiesterase domain-containing protein n=1 Tax=Diploscapter pachys TaxID=2018661 RepID=A0A2A2JIJ5_9BILA|nr:hypothetical protein WR25_05132 isoform A [Diploscapter pachys]
MSHTDEKPTFDDIYENEKEFYTDEIEDKPVAKSTYFTLLFPFLVILAYFLSSIRESAHLNAMEAKCYQTCRIRVVESIPQNISFPNSTLPMSTFSAWKQLIEMSTKELDIAAYKSSLQGKHVLGDMGQMYSAEGDYLYNLLLETGRKENIKIRMIENYPPKDKGDNADGIILQNFGSVYRRSVDIEKILGRGKMHSKFILSDNEHFYLGSANLDWRSLNQKMELGILAENCECLAQDLKRIFKVYWELPNSTQMKRAIDAHAAYNKERPLKINMYGEDAEIYVATSPKQLNNKGRTWDLDAIVSEIDAAQTTLDIHVMDYFPLFLYRKPRTHFDSIDDALRRAIVRGVKVRLLAAALHYPKIGTRFLKSLESLNNMNENATIQVKIFKVPTQQNGNILINRERRTHNKFMVTDTTVLVGEDFQLK